MCNEHLFGEGGPGHREYTLLTSSSTMGVECLVDHCWGADCTTKGIFKDNILGSDRMWYRSVDSHSTVTSFNITVFFCFFLTTVSGWNRHRKSLHGACAYRYRDGNHYVERL